MPDIQHTSSRSEEFEPSDSDQLDMLPKELTLIVAATSKNMGIGKAGGLPWTGLKKEMAYFAKVTKEKTQEHASDNVVIMGRKTWESIPEKFRPLKGRTNVAISRSYASSTTAPQDAKSALECNSLEGSLTSPGVSGPRKLFVIGGAQIYAAALERPEAKRILLTRILNDFECDTFFPISLGDDGKAPNWERKSFESLRSWVGCEVASGIQEENGIKYSFEMWEKI